MTKLCRCHESGRRRLQELIHYPVFALLDFNVTAMATGAQWKVQGSTRTQPPPPPSTFIYFHWLLLNIQPASRGGFSGQPWRRKRERWSELTFKYYLLSWGLAQEADHTALQWPEKMNVRNERIARRSLAIEPLRSVIHHIPGQRRSRLAHSPGVSELLCGLMAAAA